MFLRPQKRKKEKKSWLFQIPILNLTNFMVFLILSSIKLLNSMSILERGISPRNFNMSPQDFWDFIFLVDKCQISPLCSQKYLLEKKFRFNSFFQGQVIAFFYFFNIWIYRAIFQKLYLKRRNSKSLHQS